MMDPDLANRLRRFGEQVDQAAIAAQTQRATAAPAADTDDTDALPTVVPITAARSNRRFHMVTAAAAAAIVVVGGALVTWRLVGEPDSGPADSTQVTVNTTGGPTTTTTSSTTSTVVPTTTLPAIPLGGPSSTSPSSTTTSAPSQSSGVGAPVTSGPCPNGYGPYGTSYPIRMCDEGPAVLLIQQHVGAPQTDGHFGPATQQSVIVFQQVHGLNADGLVGRLTWAAMFPDGAPGIDSDGNGTVEPWEVS